MAETLAHITANEAEAMAIAEHYNLTWSKWGSVWTIMDDLDVRIFSYSTTRNMVATTYNRDDVAGIIS